MKNYRHIFFDFDGTLFDTSEGVFNSFDHALKSFGMPLPGHDSYHKLIGPPLMVSFTQHFGFSEEKAREAMKKYREYYTPNGVNELKIYEGIPALLERLHNAGKKIYVATSKPEPYVHKLLPRFGIMQYFDFIGGADMEETRVKKVEIINYVLEGAKITDKEDCVMIGDSHFDADGASEAGIDCIGVTWGFGTPQELLSSGAKSLYNNPNSLGDALLSAN